MDEELYVVISTIWFQSQHQNCRQHNTILSDCRSKTGTTKIALQNYQIVKPYCQIKIAKCLNVGQDGQDDRLIYVSLPALFGCLSVVRVRAELTTLK